MEFCEGDLVHVNFYSRDGEHNQYYKNFSLGLIIDVDPSEEAPTYYLISVPGSEPDWYHEDEVFGIQRTIDTTSLAP